MQHLSSCCVLKHLADDLCKALFHTPLKSSFCCMGKIKQFAPLPLGVFGRQWEEQVRLQKESKQGKFSSPETFTAFPPCNKIARKSALQASSLGLYCTLLKIYVSDVSKPLLLLQGPARALSVFQKRIEMLRAPLRGKHNPRGQSEVFNYAFFGVKPSGWLPYAPTAAWLVPAGHCSNAKGRGSYDHEPQMNVLA